jgi:hypothetical protein
VVIVGASPDGIADDPPLPHPTVANTAISSTADTAEETDEDRTESQGTSREQAIICNYNQPQSYIYRVSRDKAFLRNAGQECRTDERDPKANGPGCLCDVPAC